MMFRVFLSLSIVTYLGSDITVALGPSRPSPKKQVVKEKTAPKVKPKKDQWIGEIAKTYRTAKTIQMKVERKVSNAFFGEPETAKGDLKIQGINLRMDLKGDQDSLVVVNKGTVRIFTYPPKDSGLKTQVVETTVDGKGQTQQLFGALLTGVGIEKHFEVRRAVEKKKQIWFILKPKKKISDVAKVQLKISNKNFQIQEISLWDELENSTKYRLSDVVFNRDIDGKIFDVKIPPGAIVEKI